MMYGRSYTDDRAAEGDYLKDIVEKAQANFIDVGQRYVFSRKNNFAFFFCHLLGSMTGCPHSFINKPLYCLVGHLL